MEQVKQQCILSLFFIPRTMLTAEYFYFLFPWGISVLPSQTEATVPARAKSWAWPPRLPQLSPQHCHPPSTWARASALPALSRAEMQKKKIYITELHNKDILHVWMQRGGDWDSFLPKAAREVSTRNLNMSAAPETFLTGELVPTVLLYPRGPQWLCVHLRLSHSYHDSGWIHMPNSWVSNCTYCEQMHQTLWYATILHYATSVSVRFYLGK